MYVCIIVVSKIPLTRHLKMDGISGVKGRTCSITKGRRRTIKAENIQDVSVHDKLSCSTNETNEKREENRKKKEPQHCI